MSPFEQTQLPRLPFLLNCCRHYVFCWTDDEPLRSKHGIITLSSNFHDSKAHLFPFLIKNCFANPSCVIIFASTLFSILLNIFICCWLRHLMVVSLKRKILFNCQLWWLEPSESGVPVPLPTYSWHELLLWFGIFLFLLKNIWTTVTANK